MDKITKDQLIELGFSRYDDFVYFKTIGIGAYVLRYSLFHQEAMAGSCILKNVKDIDTLKTLIKMF